MALSQVVRKAINISPTVRALPSGLPYAPRLDLSARAPSDGHDHDHGPASRSDAPSRFAGGLKPTPAGLVHRTVFSQFLFLVMCPASLSYRSHISVLSPSSSYSVPTTSHSHVHRRKRCV